MTMKTTLASLLITLISLTTTAQDVLWKGTLYLKNGSKMESCQLLKVVGDKLQINQLGSIYGIPINDLSSASKGELGLGTSADYEAYKADFARRKAEQIAALDAELRQLERQRRLREADAQMRADAKAKREAEMERMRQQALREREIEALEAIARRLNR